MLSTVFQLDSSEIVTEWPQWMTDLGKVALSPTVLNSHMLGNVAEYHKGEAMSEGVTLDQDFFQL